MHRYYKFWQSKLTAVLYLKSSDGYTLHKTLFFGPGSCSSWLFSTTFAFLNPCQAISRHPGAKSLLQQIGTWQHTLRKCLAYDAQVLATHSTNIQIQALGHRGQGKRDASVLSVEGHKTILVQMPLRHNAAFPDVRRNQQGCNLLHGRLSANKFECVWQNNTSFLNGFNDRVMRTRVVVWGIKIGKQRFTNAWNAGKPGNYTKPGKQCLTNFFLYGAQGR